MEITTNKVDDLNLRLAITLEPADYTTEYTEALKSYRKQVKMPGFRPGHVPIGMVKKMYGKALLADELNKKLNNTLFDHIATQKLNVLGQPLPVDEGVDEGDWDNPGSFTFNYELGLAPAVDVDKAVKNIPTRYKVQVDDTMLNEHIEDLSRRFGTVNTVETSEDEDILMATLIQLNADSSVADGGFMNDASVLIREITEEASKKQLIGIQAGAEIDLNPHHLTSNHDDLATMLGITHHDVHHLEGLVRIRVSEVKRLEKKEVGPELFSMVFGEGAVEDEAAFREKLREELATMFDRDAERLFRNELYRAIIAGIDAPLPDAFLKRWMKSVNEKPLSDDDIEVQYPEYAKYVRWQIFEENVIQKHGVAVTQDDIINEAKAQVAAQYSRYGIPLNDDMLMAFAKESLKDREQYDRLRDSLRENKMFEALIANLKVNEKAVSYDDFVKAAEAASK
ncbi:MAG: trigger factor [Flavobacteriales bacterium]